MRSIMIVICWFMSCVITGYWRVMKGVMNGYERPSEFYEPSHNFFYEPFYEIFLTFMSSYDML
jgi:hypothetical protein